MAGGNPLYSSIYGQTYAFRIVTGGDLRFTGWRKIRATKSLNTVRKLMSARAAGQYEREVMDRNGIASRFTKLPLHKTIEIPNNLRSEMFFGVLAGDSGPMITAGFAQISNVARPERAALSVFTGYEPIVMQVPIRFEEEPGHDGEDIENDIAKLEMMAGRGNFKGAAQGAPARITVQAVTTGNKLINLIPPAYQWSTNNESAPIWWVSGISYEGEPWRDNLGNRIRQLCTVTLTQYVRPDVLGTPSASERAAANKPVNRTVTYTNRPGGIQRP